MACPGCLLIPGAVGDCNGFAKIGALLVSASAIFLYSMSTKVLFPPPRNVDRIECNRDRILLGRLSNSHVGARGSMVSFMMESANEFAISYNFNSYNPSAVMPHTDALATHHSQAMSFNSWPRQLRNNIQQFSGNCYGERGRGGSLG